MFASLLKVQKPKLAYNNVIGELVIRIPDLNPFGEEIEDGLYRNVVFVCPIVLSAHELRRRVAGEIGLPLKTLHLFYKGSLMDDDEVVPSEVFENLDGLEYDSDEEYFRPRICLQIYAHEETQFDDDGNEILPVSEPAQPVSDIGIDVAQEEEDSEAFRSEEDEHERELLLAGSSKEMLEMEEQQEAAYNMQMKAFNLKEELEKINCSRYYDALLKQGYGDLGAFCELTDEVLEGKGLWVSRIARSRILGLGEMLKRKHKAMLFDPSKRKRDGHTVQAMAGFAVAGLDEKFSTKAAMKRAWAASQSRTGTPAQGSYSAGPSRLPSGSAEDVQDGAWAAPSIDLTNDDLSSVGASLAAWGEGSRISRAASPRLPPPRTPKVISKPAADLIAEIERIGKRDSFDCLVNAELQDEYPIVNKKPLHWCCEVHRLEFEFTSQVLEETKLDGAISEVKAAVEKADTAGTHILPRAALRCIVNSQMKKHDMVYPPDLTEKLLDASMCNWEEVVVMKEWGRVGDNAVLYDGIPHVAYSVNTFARLLAEKLCDEETMRKYLVRDNTFKKDQK